MICVFRAKATQLVRDLHLTQNPGGGLTVTVAFPGT